MKIKVDKGDSKAYACKSQYGISIKKAVKILKKDSLTVSGDQAEIILEFMYTMAEIAVDQYLRKTKY